MCRRLRHASPRDRHEARWVISHRRDEAARSRARKAQSFDETHAAAPARIQVLRRADRLPDRARADRRGRAERLRQVEPGRGAALGDGRDLAQVDARRRHGRRDLRRHQQPAGAQHRRSGDAHRQRDRKAPAQFNEHETLEVSRRIEREKGSIYRINGREVRARDVQILFADASTGSRSPALVHQGRIGEIIQAKPEQRRRVLEEAAGISGLHARRHEAELRLSAAEQNLLRLEDVINQLAAQIDALKRQARQAVRYRNIAGAGPQGRGDAVPSALGRRQRRARRSRARQGPRASASSPSAPARRPRPPRARRSRPPALPALREAEARAAAALQRLVIARETLEREEARAKERIAELDRRLAQLDDDIERERRLAADAEAALARLATEEDGACSARPQPNAEQRAGVDARVAEADAVLAARRRRSAN